MPRFCSLKNITVTLPILFRTYFSTNESFFKALPKYVTLIPVLTEWPLIFMR